MDFLNYSFVLFHIPVSRSVWAEERAAVQWERKREEYVEQVYTQLKVELHKEDSKQRHLKSHYHIPSAPDVAMICSGQKLCEILELAPDPASVEVLFFRHVCKTAKSTINFIMSVCLCVCRSAWNHLAPTVGIFVNFDIQVFYMTCAHLSHLN
jgi:hypothetical protein